MEKEKLVSLVSAVQHGDEQAITELFNVFHNDLYYHIYKTVNDSDLAEDLLQETFIEIYQTINQLGEPAAFVTWSKQIAYHRCTGYFKKHREILADEDEDGHSIFDTIEETRAEFIPDEALDVEDLKQTIHNIIDELPEEQRSAILLRYFDEISVKEIAEIQGVSEGTVKSRLNYGRKSIKEAVESYEKKNGIKLHCVGVIPLLLWFFRKSKVANGASSTATAVSATCAAANTATPVVANGVKTAGKFAVKKLIAGIVATAVVSGGVAGAFLFKKEPQPDLPVVPTTEWHDQGEVDEPTPEIPEAPPMDWSGYGEAGGKIRRFDLHVDQMNDAHISGDLVVSSFYNPIHTTSFEGDGIVSEKTVVYTLLFETPLIIRHTSVFEYPQMEITYNKETDQFVFDKAFVYEAVLNRAKTEKSELLAQNESWSGYGKDGMGTSLKWDHLFVLDIYEQRIDEISGNLTVSYEGEIEHISKFSGRGYEQNGIIHYEILLETPRTETYIIERTLDRFWLLYDIQSETFKTVLETYDFELTKNN